jgi:hypothetical protein
MGMGNLERVEKEKENWNTTLECEDPGEEDSDSSLDLRTLLCTVATFGDLTWVVITKPEAPTGCSIAVSDAPCRKSEKCLTRRTFRISRVRPSANPPIRQSVSGCHITCTHYTGAG